MLAAKARAYLKKAGINTSSEVSKLIELLF
jgi:hypothetical protein